MSNTQPPKLADQLREVSGFEILDASTSRVLRGLSFWMDCLDEFHLAFH
jgi:hypothetical protein